MKKEKKDEFENNINNIMSLVEIEMDTGEIWEAQKGKEAVLKGKTKFFQQNIERKSEKKNLPLFVLYVFILK